MNEEMMTREAEEALTVPEEAPVTADPDGTVEAPVIPEAAETQEPTEAGGEGKEAQEPAGADSGAVEALERQERAAADYAEFARLFPGASAAELPDSVIESVNSGVPLAAAYALYERRREVEAGVAADINRKNLERSTGALKNKDASGEFFSPSEVREMSREEIRANYPKIIESMSRWQ